MNTLYKINAKLPNKNDYQPAAFYYFNVDDFIDFLYPLTVMVNGR